jgi:hypothetical protein
MVKLSTKYMCYQQLYPQKKYCLTLIGKTVFFYFRSKLICTHKKFAFGSLIYIYYGMCISESRYTGYKQFE